MPTHWQDQKYLQKCNPMYKSLAPNLGVNYPNWVMGLLTWVMDCFLD